MSGVGSLAKRSCVGIAAAVALLGAAPRHTAVETAGPPASRPTAVPEFDARWLAGQWFEVASFGAVWAQRRCVADTRYEVSMRDARRLDVVRSCTMAGGVDIRRGRLNVPRDGSGALRARFVAPLFAWIPAASTDAWVLAVAPDVRWLLIGDRRGGRLAVWSRTVALDEAALATALAAGRQQGVDASQLMLVPQPSGPARLVRGR